MDSAHPCLDMCFKMCLTAVEPLFTTAVTQKPALLRSKLNIECLCQTQGKNNIAPAFKEICPVLLNY